MQIEKKHTELADLPGSLAGINRLVGIARIRRQSYEYVNFLSNGHGLI